MGRKKVVIKWLHENTKIPTDECIVFPFSKDKEGYGHLRFRGGMCLAHRLVAVWYLKLSLFDTKTKILHSCDNPSCVNPKHLHKGTQLENIQEAKEKGNYKKGAEKRWGLSRCENSQALG